MFIGFNANSQKNMFTRNEGGHVLRSQNMMMVLLASV